MDMSEEFNRIPQEILVTKFRASDVSAVTPSYRNMFISIFKCRKLGCFL